MIRDSAFLVRDSVDHRLQTRISELVESVRKAFGDRRRQDCSALAKAILELDPQNDDALFIQSWIQCEIEQDLQLAQSLLPDLKKDETLCKEAQLIIQRVLELNPGNKAAEALRVEIDSALPTHDSRGQQDVTPDSDVLTDFANPQPAFDSVDLQQTHASVADLQPTAEPVAVPQPTHASVADLQPTAEPVAVPQPTHESIAELQPSYDSTPETESRPEQTFDSVAHSPVDESAFESAVSDDLESEYDRWPYTQPQVIGRRIWTGRNILIGSVILLSAIVLVRYIGIPRWFTSESAVTTANPDSNALGESNAFDTTASSGTLEIVIDEGVDVFINGQYAGTAPIAPIKSKPGTYQLTYHFAGADIGREEVTLAAGQLTRNSMRGFLGSLEIFVLPATNTVMQVDDNPAVPVQTHVAVRPGNHRLTFTAAGYQPSTVSVSVAAGQPRNVTVVLQPVVLGSPQATAPSRAPVQNAPTAASNIRNDVSAVASGKGTLAVSSLLPVDIYIDNNHVGTTPVTLELPVGTYNVEYRYGNLRKTAVNVIRGNEVTRATVAFEVTVQISSTPQAEVSLGGIQPKVMGTTPLAAVRVPIGSSLIFRTPGFTEKSYTVTEKDTTISMVFP